MEDVDMKTSGLSASALAVEDMCVNVGSVTG